MFPNVPEQRRCTWCPSIVKGLGLCNLHYNRWKQGASMNRPDTRESASRRRAVYKCWCGGVHHARGMCELHYREARRAAR